MSEEIKLTNPMYVVRANKKNNWFIGVSHPSNAKNDKFTDVAQNDLRFAIYFKTREEADKFLAAYTEDKADVIDPKNLKYYEVQSVMTVPFEPNANVMFYGVCGWFSTEAYCMWRRNPAKYAAVSI